MTTVKDLIKKLEKLNPNAIVLYAYNEYQQRGCHDFIENDVMVAVDNNGSVITDEDNSIVCLDKEDYDDAINGNDDSDSSNENCSVHKVKYVPAITLHSI